VFGAMDGERLRRILDGLREYGYHAFPDVLSPAQCDRLVEYARAGECEVTVLADGTRPATPRPQRYDRGAGGGMLHVFRPTDIVNLPEAQELLADASLIALAQAYLGCRPVLDLPGLWWTTPGRGGGSGEAAQLFHYDLDRLKWLKFFFYLTDVGPDNGPHVFVAGSHRSGGLAPALAERGYVRHSDAEVARAYPAERIVEMTGRRGTVFAVDTRGLHKGKPVVSGERLVLQIQFSNSLFGTRFAPARLDTTRPGALTDLWRRRPRLVSLFA
jgi:ectoine hydroxylase-related dioxygenase (phytanoyl-CoA dioxygenase family)